MSNKSTIAHKKLTVKPTIIPTEKLVESMKFHYINDLEI